MSEACEFRCEFSRLDTRLLAFCTISQLHNISWIANLITSNNRQIPRERMSEVNSLGKILSEKLFFNGIKLNVSRICG